jgi:hypothetical protein
MCALRRNFVVRLPINAGDAGVTSRFRIPNGEGIALG